MAHRETRYISKLDKLRSAPCELDGAQWSGFPSTFVVHAIWESMIKWTEAKGVSPPPGRVLKTVGMTDEVVRDVHGNAIGGVRNLYLDVPVSKLVAATPAGRPSWYHGQYSFKFFLSTLKG